MPAHAAALAGLIDRIILGELIVGAVTYAEQLALEGAPPRKVRDMKIDVPKLAPGFFDEVRKRLARERRNLFAPQRIVDAIEAAATMPFEEGIRRERDLFLQCMSNPQAKALQHVFFAERKVSAVPHLPTDAPKRAINRVSIIGGGTMGCGISTNFLNAGIPVTLLEVKQDALELGVRAIRKH